MSKEDDAGRRRSSSDFASATEKRRSFDAKAFVPERVGAEISRRYDIDKSEIGAGGYGKVYVAKDRAFGDRQVAIKKVIVQDQGKKLVFLKEVKIMKELDHPNICKLLETYEHKNFMFFVMEYCAGKEVFDRIMDDGQITEATTADIVQQAASALKYAHGKGIAHRDMKPENLVFCSDEPDDNQIKVIDWGLGFYFGQARMSSAVGSLTYAAPEVLDSKRGTVYDSSCDVWSLGVLAYVMLCGKAPFWGSMTEQLKRMRMEKFPMSDKTWQATSREAKDFIRGLLRANPANRTRIDDVLAHPWLRRRADVHDRALSSEVLSNMRRFSNTSHFFSVCVASVARQLDHRQLRGVHKVFCEMDANSDGMLSLDEVRTGFEKIFGADSEQVRDVEEMFRKLDLDGSGSIDYTEFCAAGIGEHVSMQENTLWAAFRTFDIHDEDGRVTVDEIKQVLQNGDVHKAWSAEVCSDVAKEIVEEFDENGDGTIEFNEFVKVMRDIAQRHQTDQVSQTSTERQALDQLNVASRIGGIAGFEKAYQTLEQDRDRLGGSSPLYRQVSRACSRRFGADCGGCGAGVINSRYATTGQHKQCAIL